MSQAAQDSTAPTSLTSTIWTIGFITAAFAVFALKLWLAYSTRGAPDMSAWRDFLNNIQQCGVCVYHTGGLMSHPTGERITPFNHPPFIIHYLRMIGGLSNLIGLDFAFVFRAWTSCFDLVSALLVYKLLNRSGLFSPVKFLVYLLAPATIIISGFHGQTDTLMIFFVLLAAFLINKPLLSGLAFGCALSIKILPIVFALAFILYLPRRGRLMFAGSAAVISVLLAFPYITQDPAVIIREVLGYGSFPGRWGWTRALFGVIGPSSVFWVISRISTYLLLAYIWYLSWKMNRSRVPLFIQCGLIAFVLLAFTPSWGANYMAWLDPFAATVGVWPALVYYSTSGWLLGYIYFINDDESSHLIGIAWIGVLFALWMYLRHLKDRVNAANLAKKTRH